MLKKTKEMENKLLVVGWREWVNFPEIDLANIKAKVDTGARTSCLHAFSIRPYEENGVQRVEFQTHPTQYDSQEVRTCNADVLDQRIVTNSGGQKEERWLIKTMLKIGSYSWPIEVTLSSRHDMKFRMLLGRTALRNRAMVDSARSYLIGKKAKKNKLKQR